MIVVPEPFRDNNNNNSDYLDDVNDCQARVRFNFSLPEIKTSMKEIRVALVAYCAPNSSDTNCGQLLEGELSSPNDTNNPRERKYAFRNFTIPLRQYSIYSKECFRFSGAQQALVSSLGVFVLIVAFLCFVGLKVFHPFLVRFWRDKKETIMPRWCLKSTG